MTLMPFHSIPIRFVMVLCLLLGFCHAHAQTATVTDTSMTFTTYPFSDPNPVPEAGRIYPYFYFHGYTNTPIQKAYHMVMLENEYIKVYVCPDIGGKVWGAIEKSTGKEFIYFNHVVKFRDVAMRGAWTSGGLEYNFGDIGHIPTCATPVDYTTAEHADGSVTCTVSAIDLPSGTRWNVEIKLAPGKAFFETRARWFNNTPLPCTYYHWMNAAAKASDDLEFLYPGTDRIGHGGETGPWPLENGRNLARYRNNDFGSYKSYHVINAYTNSFGGYWHDSGFGFGRLGDYDEKPGKKLWIWGLSQQGMIWEDILTDADGQYIEFQAGKLFNQAAGSSTFTPFKHREFAPHDADIMTETWFPLVNTGGMMAASPFAVLNAKQQGDNNTLTLGALQELKDTLKVFVNGQLTQSAAVDLQPLELIYLEEHVLATDTLRVVLGDHKLVYSSIPGDVEVDRPITPNPDFDWSTAYGLYTRGLEYEKQRAFAEAESNYLQSLEKEPGFLPALNRMAQSCYRKMQYALALDYLNRVLAIDTYDGEANYILGLVARKTSDRALSKSGFSIAMGSAAYRTAAATELASLFLEEQDWRQAENYARKALHYNTFNLDAMQTLTITLRKTGQIEQATTAIESIFALDPTSPFGRIEKYLLSGKASDKALFVRIITNEFPHESFLDLAISYINKGCIEEARQVLELSPPHPVIDLWLASLVPEQTTLHMNNCLSAPCDFVFPHRTETAELIKTLLPDHPHWKLQYYLGLILWNKGLAEEAKQAFAACGEAPDFAPFYLAMANLAGSNQDKEGHLARAASLDPESWRAVRQLADLYRTTGQPEKALSTITPFVGMYPEQSAVGLCYARSLCAMKRYSEAVSFLETYHVLPFEGATAGRDLYHEACIRSALKTLEEENYDRSIYYAEKAKDYPLNLGVGKPYNVDERLGNYLLTRTYTLLGEKKKASQYASKVTGHVQPDFLPESSTLYLQLLLLKEDGQQTKAENLMASALAKDPENSSVQWAVAKINQSPDATGLEEKILQGNGGTMPYDQAHTDTPFQLLLDVLASLLRSR